MLWQAFIIDHNTQTNSGTIFIEIEAVENMFYVFKLDNINELSITRAIIKVAKVPKNRVKFHRKYKWRNKIQCYEYAVFDNLPVLPDEAPF